MIKNYKCIFCGKKTKYHISPFMSNEQVKCPKCGRLNYVDRDLTDWSKIARDEFARENDLPTTDEMLAKLEDRPYFDIEKIKAALKNIDKDRYERWKNEKQR